MQFYPPILFDFNRDSAAQTEGMYEVDPHQARPDQEPKGPKDSRYNDNDVECWIFFEGMIWAKKAFKPLESYLTYKNKVHAQTF